MNDDTRVWALAVTLAIAGCTPSASTLPGEAATSDAVRAQLALGRLDARAGDPDAELVRVRRFAIAERDGVLPSVGAGTRLFALHRIALRLAQSEAERATAMAKLREDEALPTIEMERR